MQHSQWIDTCVGYLDRFGTDLFVNGFDHMEVLDLEQKPQIIQQQLFNSNQHLIECLQSFSFSQQTKLDPLTPVNGGMYQQRYRWHSVIPPACGDRPLFTLRRQLPVDQWQTIRFANLDPYLATLKQILGNQHLVICGPTGSGKTTLLQYLLALEYQKLRVAILEDIPELQLVSKRWIRLNPSQPNLEGYTGFDFAQMGAEVLRLRPDKIVVGELRTQASAISQTLFQTGHGQWLFTLHCDSQISAQKRLRDLWGVFDGCWHQKFWLLVLKRGNPPQIESLSQVM